MSLTRIIAPRRLATEPNVVTTTLLVQAVEEEVSVLLGFCTF
jgi:hypothetical protein